MRVGVRETWSATGARPLNPHPHPHPNPNPNPYPNPNPRLGSAVHAERHGGHEGLPAAARLQPREGWGWGRAGAGAGVRVGARAGAKG